MTTPDWLTQHGGEARVSKNGLSLTTYINGQPQYLLMLAPVGGSTAARWCSRTTASASTAAHRFPRRKRRSRAVSTT